MPISQEDFDSLVELTDQIESALSEAENLIRHADPSLYERWKAYGKHVTSEFITMGLNLQEVVLQLGQEIEDEEDDEEDEEDDEEDEQK